MALKLSKLDDCIGMADVNKKESTQFYAFKRKVVGAFLVICLYISQKTNNLTVGNNCKL